MPSILMFAPMCIPPSGAEQIVAAKFVTAASRLGWGIDVITWTNSALYYPEKLEERWYEVNGEVFSICDENRRRVKNIPKLVFAAINTGHLTSGLIWADRAIKLAKKLIGRKHYDIIISRSHPYWGHLPALTVARLARLPWLAVWNDPVPKAKEPPPYGRGTAATIPFLLKRYMNAVCRNADINIFPTERLLDYMCSYLPGGTASKSAVIPHVSLRWQMPSVPHDEKFVVLHSGSLDEERNLENFLIGTNKARRNNEGMPLELHWVGKIDDKVKEQILSHGLDGCSTYRGSMSYPDAMKYQGKAAILVVIEVPCEIGIYLPSKFVDYVQTGRPILAVSPKVGTLNDILSRCGGGIAADVNSPDSIAAALETLYAQWKSGTLEESYGSGRLYPLFSEEYVMGEYMKIFERLMKKRADQGH